jgi:xanthine dehydrogenase YagT iron-sulfur-binding subunit
MAQPVARSAGGEEKPATSEVSRRTFVSGVGAGGAYAAIAPSVQALAQPGVHDAPSTTVTVVVNGKSHSVRLEDRTTLLDALRDQVGLTGTKKGCDRGECGACTVHVGGRRVLSCMSLAVMQAGKSITTVEGIAEGSRLHPVQSAFIERDGFQCGYCTSGQIMSGVALLREARLGWPSAATSNVSQPFLYSQLSDAEVRERMSGNLCRCACYPNIVDAIVIASRKG